MIEYDLYFNLNCKYIMYIHKFNNKIKCIFDTYIIIT